MRGHYLSVAPQIGFSRETGSKACRRPCSYDGNRSSKARTFRKLGDPTCAGRSFVLGRRFPLLG